MNLKKVTKNLKKGNFVLIHDSSDREDETDMVIPAETINPKDVARMRQDAGGLICVAIHPEVASTLKLPYLSDIYRSASSDHEILDSAKANDLPYDEHSSFSISVNHRDTFTGITDSDRALTISELGKLSREILEEGSENNFGKKFRTPGHVPLLRAADNLLEDRGGHTEFSIAMMEMAGVSPAAVVCEMLDSETKEALSAEKARKYSQQHGIEYVEGREVKEEFEKIRRE